MGVSIFKQVPVPKVIDVELAFLFPWAVLYRQLGVVGFIEVGVFIFFIFLGYIYALKKGALDAK